MCCWARTACCGAVTHSGLLHHLTRTAEITSGPGIEIDAGELLLDLVHRFDDQGVVANQIRLDISTEMQPTLS